jgi:hypothetical protein
MAKPKSSPAFELECPCCKANLKIDPEVRAVIAYKEAEKPREIADIAAGLEKLREKESQRDSVFAKRMAEEKASKDVLARKFDELFKRAQEDPDKGPPQKPFDLD